LGKLGSGRVGRDRGAGAGAIAAVALAALAALLLVNAPAGAQEPPPNPLQGAAGPALSNDKCADPTYTDCKRLHFALGPISITPGANYQLVGQEIAKPNYDGYMVRMNANMVRPDGSIPPVDQLHLHHAVWVSVPQYGSYLPFYGVGEEKTIAQSVHGYGLPIKGTDVWLLNYMLHNLTTQTEPVYVVYDIDFVPKAAAEAQGIKPVYPLWIDVRNGDHPDYPVFNVQKGFGHVDTATGRHVCSYPKETCAAFDPYGKPQAGNGKGYDWTVPPQWAGTLIGLGGHVHPGGLTDEVSLVRNVDGQEHVRRIFNSRAQYFDRGGPISWDMAMTVTPKDWRIQIRPGDKIRLNAVYDAEQASYYEGMGIVMAYVSPRDSSGVDPFQKQRVNVPVRQRVKERVKARVRKRVHRRRARRGHRGRYRYVDRYVNNYVYRYVPIQTEGAVTHGHLAENNHHGGQGAVPLPGKRAGVTSNVDITNFTYSPGDLTTVDSQGVPKVKADQPLTFTNQDSAVGIWHTITTCEAPCTGEVGISYPIANALPPLDSTELGYAPDPTGAQPVSQTAHYQIVPDQAGLKPGHLYTYFCRIHPFMRGAFEVVR
jgi:hypothetical protein